MLLDDLICRVFGHLWERHGNSIACPQCGAVKHNP